MKKIVFLGVGVFVLYTASGQQQYSAATVDTVRTSSALRAFTAAPTALFCSYPAANFYADHLPFFCKQELKLQKAGIPVLFRVGSVNQCDYLEGKGRK